MGVRRVCLRGGARLRRVAGRQGPEVHLDLTVLVATGSRLESVSKEQGAMKEDVDMKALALWMIVAAILLHACVSDGSRDVYIRNWPVQLPSPCGR